MITAEYVRDVLDYEPSTGVFTWRKTLGARAQKGASPRCVNNMGYVVIRLRKKLYLAHRLAWLHTHGELPECIDHANGDKTDNRIANLRPATHAQNMANLKKPVTNSSGFKGVHFHPQTGKWRARIRASGKHVSLGLFDHPTEAARAYDSAALQRNGAFARVNGEVCHR